MTEWIAAERDGAVLGVLEELLARCAGIDGLRERGFEIIDMDVEVCRPAPSTAFGSM